ncbi:MAG: FdhD protein [Halieaceae bacterium]|jgi:FdhD protein
MVWKDEKAAGEGRVTEQRRGVRRVNAIHLPGGGGAAVAQICSVVEEDTLTLDVAGIGQYTLMWTPTEKIDSSFGFTDVDGVLSDAGNPEALCLAAGFALSEGIITSLDDIHTMALCADEPDVVQLELKDVASVEVRRANVLIRSSCGVCGYRDIVDKNMYQLQSVDSSMRLSESGFGRLMADMRAGQLVFGDTGGCHGAALFGVDGNVRSVSEDLGRHNALDKAIGRHLLEGHTFTDSGVLLSSRLSLEMIVKAIRAGIQIVAAVSAPTSLAIELADRFGVTLCGFVRDERMTVYTHPWRIAATGALPDFIEK